MSDISLFDVLYAFVKAPVLMLDLPSFREVVLTSTFVTDGDSSDPYDGTRWINVPHRQLCLRGTSRDGLFNRAWEIDIDDDVCVIERADWHILTPKLEGSHGWDILTMILGIPGLIVASPVLVLWWSFRWLLSVLTGLDLHQVIAWYKLRDQLPKVLRPSVLKALRNMNNGCQQNYRSFRVAQQEELRRP